MSQQCPKCKSENVYQDGYLWICPECVFEWNPAELGKLGSVEDSVPAADSTVRDANGVELKDGDSVIVAKDLKIKGASGAVKGGTKVRNIRLFDAGDGHNISCKIDGLGAINLKSEYVRKV
jgi:protein PhnA